jgi:hypothetical protein
LDYKDCGKVVGSSSQDRPLKHGMTTDLYLLIDFEKDGFQAQEVGPTTYFKYKDKIGTELCFDQTKRNPEFSKGYNEFVFIFGGLFLVIYFVVFIFIFCSWLE